MTLRPAVLADAPNLVRVFVKARMSWAFLPWEYDVDFMARLFLDHWIPDEDMWVAETDGDIVGLVSLKDAELERLYVLPAWHGKGVGLILLDQAKALSADELWLWVFQENRQARRFYEKHGFVLHHETDGRGNMEKCPDARYVWRK